ncbi:hypothetical protein BHE74_00041679, partial [Ensete ventricosum]
MLNLARKDNPAVSALDVISSTFAGSFSSSSVHEDALKIDRRRSIEEEKGKKKKRKRKKKKKRGKKEYLASVVLARLSLPPAGRLRAVATRGSPVHGRGHGRRPRPLFLPREETDRGD